MVTGSVTARVRLAEFTGSRIVQIGCAENQGEIRQVIRSAA